MRTRVACLLVVAIVATGVAFALTRPGRHVEGSGRDLAAPYFAIVWLPRGESHARAELVTRAVWFGSRRCIRFRALAQPRRSDCA
jgi:hypothetical protein